MATVNTAAAQAIGMSREEASRRVAREMMGRGYPGLVARHGGHLEVVAYDPSTISDIRLHEEAKSMSRHSDKIEEAVDRLLGEQASAQNPTEMEVLQVLGSVRDLIAQASFKLTTAGNRYDRATRAWRDGWIDYEAARQAFRDVKDFQKELDSLALRVANLASFTQEHTT